MKQRNHAFDFLCGLCILRMMLLHVITICSLQHTFWFHKLMAWTFFFMCFFFFKAGYFNKTVSGNSIEYIKDKSKRLLTPYIAWGFIGTVIYFSFLILFPSSFTKLTRALEWSHIYKFSYFYGNPPCWFLLSFFMAYIAVHFIEKAFSKVGHKMRDAYGMAGNRVLTVAYFALIGSLPFISYYLWKHHNPMILSLNNVFMGVFFFYLGHLWHKMQNRIGRKQTIIISVILILIFVVGNKMWHGEYHMSHNKFIQNVWGAGINATCALCGISGLLLALPIKRVPVINYIGEHSMVFFVAHQPLIYFYVFTHQVFGRSVCKHWDEFITLSVFVIVICLCLVPFVEKVPVLSGRFKKKN